MSATNLRTLLTCAALLAWHHLAGGAEFEPKYEAAELYGPDHASTELIRVDRHPRQVHEAGGNRIVVDGNVVELISHNEPPRRIASTDGRMLRLLGTTGTIALFAGENTKEELKGGAFYLRAEIRRLDLATAERLPSWRFEHPADQKRDGGVAADNPRLVLASVLADERGVAVVVCDEPPKHITKIKSYTVALFDPQQERVKWAKAFASRGEGVPAMTTMAGVWGADAIAIVPLSWLEGESDPIIIVCAGTKEDVLCLDAESGETRWRIPRIWEYERGFIGPSVFEHFVERFGIDYMDAQLAGQSDVKDDAHLADDQKKARQLLADTQRKFDETYSGWITAGPIIPAGDGDGNIFIAAARQRGRGQDLGDLAQATVYELDSENGEVIAASPLPRLVDGHPQHAMPGAILWGCQRGGLVRLHGSGYNFAYGFNGPNAGWANDSTCSIAWYREYGIRLPASWFYADAAYGVAAFDSHYYYRPSGAYIETRKRPVYRFVINRVDLETGLDRDLTLSIPYMGDFPMPKTGYAASPGSMHSTHPHLLWIGGLSVEDNVLRVVMKRPGDEPEEKQTWQVEDTVDAALDFRLPEAGRSENRESRIEK